MVKQKRSTTYMRLAIFVLVLLCVNVVNVEDAMSKESTFIIPSHWSTGQLWNMIKAAHWSSCKQV